MSRFDEVTAARPRNGGALALLGSRRFGPLFATQFLSAFNDNAVRNVRTPSAVEPAGSLSMMRGVSDSAAGITARAGTFNT